MATPICAVRPNMAGAGAYPARAAWRLARWLVLTACLLMNGCSTLGYYTHLAAGEWSLLRARRPLAAVIADPATSPELRARLQLAAQAREFASAVLQLPRNKSYTSYADIGRPFVMWNVFATPALSVQAIEHCFPIAGCVAYRGYYQPARAQAYAQRLQAKGDDVWVGGVPAYSTLGHFADPLLSSMNRWSADEWVGTIFHELAHQKIYLPGDTRFNESYASFVEYEGLREWRAARKLPPPDPEQAEHAQAFTQLVLATRTRLQTLYASDRSDTEKRDGKARIFANLRKQYAQLRAHTWHDDSRYDAWFAQPLNNARLLPFGLYDGGVPAFAALFKHCARDWACFHAAVRAHAQQSPSQRAAFLDAGEPQG